MKFRLDSSSFFLAHRFHSLTSRRQIRSYDSVLNSRLWIDWQGQKSPSMQDLKLALLLQQPRSHGQMTVRCHDAENLLQPWLLSTNQVQETKLFLSDSPRCWAVHRTLPSLLWLICLQNILCWKMSSKLTGCPSVQITFKSPDDCSSNRNSIDISSDLWFLEIFSLFSFLFPTWVTRRHEALSPLANKSRNSHKVHVFLFRKKNAVHRF